MQPTAFHAPKPSVSAPKPTAETPGSKIDESFYRLLLEASQIIYFEYHPLTDILHLSTPDPDGVRKWRTVPCVSCLLLNSAYVPQELQQSLLKQWMNRAKHAGKESLSLCVDMGGKSEYRWYICHLCALGPQNGKVERVIGYLHDIHGEREKEQKLRDILHKQKYLEQRAATDTVTGLLNRGTLEKRACALLCKSEQPCYFFIFDVDNFKQVNDHAGHCEGDRILSEVAGVLRRYTRSTDLVGRIGGDEFVALICGLPCAEAAKERAVAILGDICNIKSPALRQDHFPVSASVGIAASIPGCCCYQTLYHAADQALYRAKELGKNRCCMAEE